MLYFADSKEVCVFPSFQYSLERRVLKKVGSCRKTSPSFADPSFIPAVETRGFITHVFNDVLNNPVCSSLART